MAETLVINVLYCYTTPADPLVQTKIGDTVYRLNLALVNVTVFIKHTYLVP